MPPSEIRLGAVIVAALMLYLLFGGADFGGGVWDLLALGPRRARQRKAIEHAIGPIWEANHVWLILVVVVLFTGFPPAFAALSTALHVPLTLFLLGVVLRGSSFAFRALDPQLPDDHRHRLRWGLIFSLASVLSPFLLGMVVGAVASGTIRIHGGLVSSGFFGSWLSPFAVAVGLFALALCAFLAATYLAAEVGEPDLQRDFRARALGAGIAVGACALLAFLLSGAGAPRIRLGLSHRPWTWPLHAATAAAAISALVALWRGRFRGARLFAGAQTVLIIAGWATAQYPYLLVPDLTIWNAAAPRQSQTLLLAILLGGVPVLAPSLWVLFRVFKNPALPEAGRSSSGGPAGGAE
jgi:cytochrome d ubiquinol oxidase subunit II